MMADLSAILDSEGINLQGYQDEHLAQPGEFPHAGVTLRTLPS